MKFPICIRKTCFYRICIGKYCINILFYENKMMAQREKINICITGTYFPFKQIYKIKCIFIFLHIVRSMFPIHIQWKLCVFFVQFDIILLYRHLAFFCWFSIIFHCHFISSPGFRGDHRINGILESNRLNKPFTY